MNVVDICQAIKFGSLSNEDLDNIARAVRHARACIGKSIVRSVTRGAKVSFTGQSGHTFHGVVDSVKIKNVIVDVSGRRWRVPANMLTVL